MKPLEIVLLIWATAATGGAIYFGYNYYMINTGQKLAKKMYVVPGSGQPTAQAA